MRTYLAILSFLALSVAVEARTRSENIYQIGEAETVKAGGHAVYLLGGDIDSDGFRGGGAQFLYQYSKFFAMEGSISVYNDTLHVDESTAGHSMQGRIERETIAFMATARAELPVRNWFGLYAGGGIGWYSLGLSPDLRTTTSTDYTDQGATSSTSASADDSWGLHWMAGLQWRALDNLQLFAEYRWQFVDSSVTASSTVTSSTGVPETGTATSYEGFDHGVMRLGFNLYF